MGISAAAGYVSSIAGSAVDAYRSRLEAQAEQRRLVTLQIGLLTTGSLAAVGMVVDAVSLQLRVQALQRAVDEAIEAGDLLAAEKLRADLVAALHDQPASARLLATLAEYIPALMAQHNGSDAPIIEGRAV